MHGDTNKTDEECEAAMETEIDVPELTDLQPRITVIGVGGAGGNAINNMIGSGLTGVEFVAANTDAQALSMSSADTRIQIGVNVTEGLGAGSRPEIGAAAAEEAEEDLRSQLSGSHMVFVAAGMGGGTGTGAAPVIARIAREENILTVGVVTKPFQFEGRRRMRAADAGIEELQKHVDTLIVIPNQNLFRIANEKTTFEDAFKLADQVLHDGVACITDLILNDGLINLDFADVEIVVKGMGAAMMGTGEASGEDRAVIAAGDAITNPLLDDISLQGAKGVLVSITGGADLTLHEIDKAVSLVGAEVDPDAIIIVGATNDDQMEGRIRVSIVASGLSEQSQAKVRPPQIIKQPEIVNHQEPAPGKPRLMSRVEGAPFGSRTKASDVQPAPAIDDSVRQEPTVWQGPGDVTIEQRPPQLRPGAHMPPASPEGTPQGQPFVPTAPANAKPAARPMPKLEDLPAIAQNEINAKKTKQYNTGLREQKKKVGFFERLAGVGRPKRASDSDKITPQEAWPGPETTASIPRRSGLNEAHGNPVNKLERLTTPPGQAHGASAAHKKSSRDNSTDSSEDVEFPEFLHRNNN